MKRIVVFAFIVLLPLLAPGTSRAEFDLEREVLSIPDYHAVEAFKWDVSRNPPGFDFTLGVTQPTPGGHHEIEISVPGACRVEDLHVFVTDKTFELFEHFTPQEMGDKSYAFNYGFAEAGRYHFEIAFKAAGAWVNVTREVDIELAAAPPELGKTMQDEGYEVRVKPLPSEDILADHVVTLVFELFHHGEPVRDLEIMNGAEMHLAAWKTSWWKRIGNFHYAASGQNLGGPRSAVSLVFDEAGRYKTFVQFKHAGAVRTVDLELAVGLEPQRLREGFPNSNSSSNSGDSISNLAPHSF